MKCLVGCLGIVNLTDASTDPVCAHECSEPYDDEYFRMLQNTVKQHNCKLSE
jgi:hypothetical protein